MAYLINRNPAGRLICLHALAGYLVNRFATNKFRLNDLKYDEECQYNIHQTCQLLEKLPAINFPVCPYLDNPLSKAKCYLTQSIQEDKQKSKSASDVFNALEGLGIINRSGNLGYITQEGLEFAKSDYDTPQMFGMIRRAVQRYGPFWGLLFWLDRNKNRHNIIKREDISIGYPETQETLSRNSRIVVLSTGSQADTITRTRSVLFAWAITAGFLLPVNLTKPKENSRWHEETLPFIRGKKWSTHQYEVYLKDSLISGKPYVDRPLEYNAMTKSTKALRERNQEEQRSITLGVESIIKNRRFAISYLLALASEQDSGVSFDKMVSELASHEAFFIINKQQFAEVLNSELEISFIAGIPFIDRNRILFPLTKLNVTELSKGAPKEVIALLQDLSKKVLAK